MIAYCGLDCSKCEGFLATKADSNSQRAEVARKWSALYDADIKPEQINCDGCKAQGRKLFYCENLCEIRKCCTAKGVDHCAACKEYPCQTVSAFIQMAPEAGKALERLRSE
jgi:hypothetical protein